MSYFTFWPRNPLSAREERREEGERLQDGRLRGRAEIAVRERHVDRAPGLPRERDPDEVGAHGILRGRLGVERDARRGEDRRETARRARADP